MLGHYLVAGVRAARCARLVHAVVVGATTGVKGEADELVAEVFGARENDVGVSLVRSFGRC